jgi:hypothetical protein
VTSKRRIARRQNSNMGQVVYGLRSCTCVQLITARKPEAEATIRLRHEVIMGGKVDRSCLRSSLRKKLPSLQTKRHSCSWLNVFVPFEEENHVWGEEKGLNSEREDRQAQGPWVFPLHWWANRRTHGRAQQFVIPQPWLGDEKIHVRVM